MESDSRDVGQFRKENIETIHQFCQTFLHLFAVFVLEKCLGKLQVPFCVNEAFNTQPRNATLRLIGRSSTPRPKNTAACVLHGTCFRRKRRFFGLNDSVDKSRFGRVVSLRFCVFFPTLRASILDVSSFRTPSWWRWLPGTASGPTLRRWTRRLLPGRRRPAMDGVMFHVALDLSTSGARGKLVASESDIECNQCNQCNLYINIFFFDPDQDDMPVTRPEVHLRRRTTSIQPGGPLLGESH